MTAVSRHRYNFPWTIHLAVSFSTLLSPVIILFQVTFYTSAYYELAWQKSRYSTDGAWQRVQIQLPTGVQQAIVDGVVGSDTNMAASYIAVDDITVSQDPCDMPSELLQ